MGSGELIVEHEGVYRSAAWPVDVKSRCAAFCAADDRVVVCCGGAAQLCEYRSCTKVGVHITTTAPGRPIGGSTVVHRCSIMPTGHADHRPDGIRVTSPVRTVFDLTKHVEPITLESVIEQGLRRRQFDITALYDVGKLLCRRGRDGASQFDPPRPRRSGVRVLHRGGRSRVAWRSTGLDG